VSRSKWQFSLSVAAIVGSTVFAGCTDSSVNPPLADTKGVAPVSPEEAKNVTPKTKREMPRGSAKIGRDPSGVNRGN
jgi:hypothetical protein